MVVVEAPRSILSTKKDTISVKSFTQKNLEGIHGSDVRTPTPEGNLS
jgi:hypothetical protein